MGGGGGHFGYHSSDNWPSQWLMVKIYVYIYKKQFNMNDLG